MKTIGLLGGTSWPSTPLYYEYLNRKTAEYFGGYHAAEIILYSIDYHEIKSLYNAPDGWQKIPVLLADKYSRLESMQPDCIMICNNTLHRALPNISGQFNPNIPFIDLITATGQKAKQLNLQKPLLLGTQFTMEDGFFAERLANEYQLDVAIPSLEDRSKIQTIQTAVSTGKQHTHHQQDFAEIINSYPAYDGVILACTELPLIADQKDFRVPLINTIHAQCDAALKLTLV